MNKALIVATMLKLPWWHLDHLTVEEKTALVDPLAQVIAEEAKTPEEAAALTAHTSKEVNFAKYVLTGHCDMMPAGVRCDGGRARGPFQVHGFCKAAWQYPDGTIESYRAGARCVLSTLRAGLSRCHGDWIGAFAGLRGAPVCQWERAPAYAERQNQILRWWRGGVIPRS